MISIQDGKTRKMTKPTKPTMLVVRANRESCLAFYNKFRQFDIDYIASSNGEFTPTVHPISSNVHITNLHYKAAFGIDPVSLLNGRVNNLSLVNVDHIEDRVRQCDVVNLTDTYYCFNAQIARLARKYAKPVVTIVWTTIANHPSVWIPPYSLFTREVVKATNLFILRCESAYAFTDSLDIDRAKTHVIYKGVDLDHFHPKASKGGKKTNQPIKLVYVGNYHRSKGILTLLEAFDRLVSSGRNVRLLMAGRGDLTSLIDRQSKRLPIDNLGFVDYAHLGDVYRSADIFCSPSQSIKWLGLTIWEEYFSYTLMEAQASGLPIVTTVGGGVEEEVGVGNMLVPPSSVGALYEALVKLVDNRQLRETVGRANRRRAQKLFNAVDQAKQTENAMRSLLG